LGKKSEEPGIKIQPFGVQLRWNSIPLDKHKFHRVNVYIIMGKPTIFDRQTQV
jgi:hypothetical protein